MPHPVANFILLGGLLAAFAAIRALDAASQHGHVRTYRGRNTRAFMTTFGIRRPRQEGRPGRPERRGRSRRRRHARSRSVSRVRYGYNNPMYPNGDYDFDHARMPPEHFQPYGRNENGTDAEWDEETLVDDADARYQNRRFAPPAFPAQRRAWE